MADAGEVTGPCPSCGATVRPDDQWCTLCFADLRPPPPPAPPAPLAAPPAGPPVAPVAPAPPPALGPGWRPAGAAFDPLTAPLSALVAVPASPLAAAPAAPPAPPAPVAPAAPAAPVDPLTAPLSAVLGQPLAADPEAPSLATWPCVECGGRSPLEAAACATCGTPFGGRIARLDDAKAVRQKRMFVAVGAAVAFLCVLAALTFATTTPPEKVPDEIVETIPAP